MSLRLWCLILAACACNGKPDAADDDVSGGGGDADTDADADADTDTDTGPLPDPQATLTTGGPVACTTVTRSATTWFERRSVPSPSDSDDLMPLEPWVWGSGLVVADFDGDDLIDVFAANEVFPQFFHNSGLTLDDVAPAVFGGMDIELTTGGSAADYDGDGDLDLYVGNYGFVDETIPSDEFLPGEPDWLLVNDGDGTFTDLSAVIPTEVHEGYAYAVAWIDLDDNGFPELYTVNDFGVSYPNKLMWNTGGVLTLDGNVSGLDGAWTGMGLDFADLNHDGVPDVFLPVWNGLILLESFAAAEAPLWVESAGSRTLKNDLKLRDQKVAWGGDFGDVDNDGDEDLLVQYGWVTVGNGEEWANPLRQPDGLYIMAGDTYSDQAPALGLDDMGIGRGGVFADFNNDGFLDIVKRDVGGASIAYLSMCDTNAWTRIRLQGVGANTHAIGAKVRATAGGQVQTGWMRAGGLSLASSGPPEIHFGFGAVETIDQLEIRWPDGRISLFADVPTREVLDIAQLPPTP